MAERFIPRKTRVKTEFVRGVTGGDIFWLGTGIILIILIFMSNMENIKVYLCIFIALLFLIGFVKTGDDQRNYYNIWLAFKFVAVTKKYAKITGGGYKSIQMITPYSGIKDGVFIDYGSYLGAVVEISPIEFGLLGSSKQDMVINQVANALRRVGTSQSASLIRLERAMVLDKYIDYEIEKYNTVSRNLETGALSEDEMEAREVVFQERGLVLEYMNDNERIFKSCYYLVVYDSNRETLAACIEGILGTLNSGVVSMPSKLLKDKELAIFLRANYNKDFDERQIYDMPDTKIMNWIVPNKVEFTGNSVKINGLQRAGMKLSDYPLQVGNAWGYGIFNMPGCRTVMNFHQVAKYEAERIIDRAIMEMKTQMEHSHKSSHQIEHSAQLETITDLLVQIKQNNENMYDCTVHFTPDWDVRKEVRARLKEEGFKYSDLFGQQVDSYLSSNVSRLETFDKFVRGIPTTTIAAAFPFISDQLQDDRGVCLGSNSYPVFIDFFKRDNVRVNSNMIIIGKSGSGKSFAAKSLLLHLAADNTKVFICDPEKEYTTMTERLHGNVIDVGNAGKGRFNPFHVYPAMLDDDDGGVEFDDTFESHLRFLESFFKIVMEGIRNDALEALNGLVARMYKLKGIDKYTDFNALQPEHFPTFQDLFDIAKQYHQNAADDFARINYRILVTYLEKFADGGRYSGLWNGPASIRTNENFVTFNFLTLLSNKNSIVANAQMLLVFKYLDGEIIKNRDYNVKHGMKRKIVIVVDEAHVFIDEQRPIALDFMFNMAKRIRKYDGMQIIITQNVKDFVGSPSIAKKSAAIINASQYSMIFSLAPNDMSDLVTLYKNAGEINKQEQNQIISNARGQCFFITGPMNRTAMTIDTSDEMRKLFE